VLEELWRSLEHDSENQELFADELNRFFREKGIGWELKDPDGIAFAVATVIRRGVRTAIGVLSD